MVYKNDGTGGDGSAVIATSNDTTFLFKPLLKHMTHFYITMTSWQLAISDDLGAFTVLAGANDLALVPGVEYTFGLAISGNTATLTIPGPCGCRCNRCPNWGLSWQAGILPHLPDPRMPKRRRSPISRRGISQCNKSFSWRYPAGRLYPDTACLSWQCDHCPGRPVLNYQQALLVGKARLVVGGEN